MYNREQIKILEQKRGAIRSTFLKWQFGSYMKVKSEIKLKSGRKIRKIL